MSSVCAGLGQALQQGWRQGFPLQASPFQELARQTGASLRELLAQCQQLQRQGALQGPSGRWGARLSAWRWRCSVILPPGPDLEAQAMHGLSGLPGCAWVEQLGPSAKGPSLWFELQSRSAAGLRQQTAWLDAWSAGVPGVHWQALALPEPDGPNCQCADHAGPCTDPQLARRVEAGLPLCAHPFQAVASELGRSEREVLTALRRWQQAGDLQGLGLAPPHRVQCQAMATALLPGVFTAEQLQALRRHAGVVDAQPLPDGGAGEALLWLSLAAPRELAVAQLDHVLAAEGLAQRPTRRWLGLRCTPRAQALVFS